MNKLIESLAKVPLTTKLGVVAAAVALLTGGCWYFIIDSLELEILTNRTTLMKLEKDVVDKKVIADNLNQYRHDKEVLERRLAEALTELPATRDIDELLRQLNDVGKKSGLEIVSIEPGAEAAKAFYAEIPVRMQVYGNFHEIAVFFESVSKLRRIVNVSSLTFTSPLRKNEKVVLSAAYLATTFRFLEPSETKKKAP
jgi:type IV pilus assembly protein PilO